MYLYTPRYCQTTLNAGLTSVYRLLQSAMRNLRPSIWTVFTLVVVAAVMVDVEARPWRGKDVYVKGILQSVRGSHINLHMYIILAVPSNCAQRSLINN